MLGDSLEYINDKVLGSEEGIRLVLSDVKFIGPILGNVCVITLGIDVGTELRFLDGYFYASNYGKLEGLLLGDSLGYTDGKVIGSDEGIKLVLSDGKVLVTILANVYGNSLGLDVGTYLGSLDGSFDGSNYGNIDRLLLGDSLGYTDGKVLGFDEFIKLVISDGKVIVTILGDLYVITPGLDFGTELRYLDGSFDSSNYGNIERQLLGEPLGYTDERVLGFF